MFLTDQETEKVLNTINGKAPEDEVLKDMKVFFRKTFSVEILDYIYRPEDGTILHCLCRK